MRVARDGRPQQITQRICQMVVDILMHEMLVTPVRRREARHEVRLKTLVHTTNSFTYNPTPSHRYR